MLYSLDARRDRLLTNSLYTQTSGAELLQVQLVAHSMRVHPSDSLSLQPGKSPLQRSSPAGSSLVGPLLQVPSRDIRASGHASRRVHKTTFPQPTHIYEVRPRKDHRGVDLIFDALPFGRLWYGEPNASATQSIMRSSSAAHTMP